MVARINTGKSIRGMLHYNENKVRDGEAQLILASGFVGEIGEMSFNQKYARFHHLTMLKPNVKTNAMHISLNFHSSEQLSDPQLQLVAQAYMDKIGFGDQPYVVYRHDDSAHQHVHIVTTNITKDRQRIDLHDIGKKLSEPARKAIEKEFNLVRAQGKELKVGPGIKAADPVKAQYGKLPTKKAMSNIVAVVSRDYLFTSLAEYNAILKGFNVMAFRGGEDTDMFQRKGLMYTMLDAKGQPAGVPIKSSAFYSKPTLWNLEKKFGPNTEKRKEYRLALKQRLDQVLGAYASLTRGAFLKETAALGIEVNFRENEHGFIFGITYIDHQNKTVFNGSDLGKAYSAKAITERFSSRTKQQPKEKGNELRSARRKQRDILQQPQGQQIQPTGQTTPAGTSLLETLLANGQTGPVMGAPRKRKKKKKKGQEPDYQVTL
ncbi:MAG: relaxase [Mucilaginibacter sp.]|nr:relaxase [Mucilaginibacter sp.]